MKTPEPSPTPGRLSRPRRNCHRSERGFAMVVTLMLVALLAVLIIAFFIQARTDLTMADAYAQTTGAKQLSESAVNLVIGQIRDGTVGFERDGSGALDTSNRLGWASQPGMLRTYSEDGQPYQYYKLYSDDEMVIDPGDVTLDAEDIADEWTPSGTDAFDALWSDLNAPVARSDGSLAYPIVTPPDTLDSANGVPVDDPSTDTQEGVQGFSVTNPPGFSGSDPSAVNNPVPMPVKWLYVLADGTIVTPTGTPTQVTVSGATAANPIVGRLAFWTDDESCKLNLNTAAEGIFWDQPRGNTWMERAIGQAGTGNTVDPSEQLFGGVFGFGWALPLQNEFNRYPGHPATTSLSAVYGDVLPVPADFVKGLSDFESINEYYRFSPQYRDFDGSDPETAGSKGGLQIANVQVSDFMTPKSDRLYASLHELYFDPSRTSQAFDPAEISGREFFTTTASKAPDTTIFGTPRISMWPQMLDDTLRNSKDALLAFCSELRPVSGGTTETDEYYIQRHSPYYGENNPGSSRQPELDWGIPRNVEIYDYIRNLTNESLPGLGGRLVDKYGARTRDQIITQMVDYIRGSVNTLGNKLTPEYTYAAPLDNNYYSTGSITVQGRNQVYPLAPDSGSAAGTRGFSRAPTIRSVTLVFYPTDILKDQDLRSGGAWEDLNNPEPVTQSTSFELVNGLPAAPANNPYPARSPFGDPDVDDTDDWVDLNGNGVEGEIFADNPSYTPGGSEPEVIFLGERLRVPYATEIGCVVMVEPLNISPGAPRMDPNIRIRISGLDSLTANGQTFFSNGSAMMRLRVSQYGSGRNPNNGLNALLMHSNGDTPRTLGGTDEDNNFLWLGDQQVSVDPGAPGSIPPGSTDSSLWANKAWRNGPPTFSFGGGLLNIEILDGSDSSRVIQTVSVRFPASTFPAPTLRRSATGYQVGSNANDIRGKDFQVDLDVADLANEATTNGIHPMERDLRFYTFSHSGEAADEFQKTSTENTVQVREIATSNVLNVPDGTFEYTPAGGSNAFVNPMEYSDRLKPNSANHLEFTRASGDSTYRAFENTGWFRRGDVVRSVELSANGTARGDYRLAAVAGDIDATDGLYLQHPSYDDVDVPHAFAMRPDGHSGTIGFSRVGLQNNGSVPNSGEGGLPEPCVWSTLPPFIEDLPSPYQDAVPAAERDLYAGRFSQGASPAKGSFHGSLIEFDVAPHERGTDAALDTDGSLSRLWDDSHPFYAAFGMNGAYLNGVGGDAPGDWDNSFGRMVDGPWINFPDQASIWEAGTNYAQRPDRIYFSTDAASTTEGGYSLSPNRQIPSPVMFGSLPSGIDPDDPGNSLPWQTLLFCPNPAAGDAHPGFGVGTGGNGSAAFPPYTEPPDHVWLDFFTMPVVEPYAISEPFSTAGRVNMNYRMQPFEHIDRSTGIHGVLKNMQLAAIPTAGADASEANRTNAWTYTATPANGDVKNQFRTGNQNNGTYHEFRYDIDVEETLTGFEQRFDNDDLFRSTSEICSIFLVPEEFDFSGGSRSTSYHPTVQGKAATYNNMQDWWGESTNPPDAPVPTGGGDGFLATGDNTREMPYNHIYPRLTTKSNTYRVHFTVQQLRQRKHDTDAEYETWVEGTDQVVGEYRGSALLERFIDPNDPDLPDFATVSLTSEDAVLDRYYRFRVLETKRFSP